VIIGTTYGVNMLEELKNDKRLRVNTSMAYNGFLFQPSIGWLANGIDNKTTISSGHTNKDQSTMVRNKKATVDARTTTESRSKKTTQKN
jgi:hypothetical protein